MRSSLEGRGASQLRGLGRYPKIAVAYTQIVTISTDNILETREFRASVGAQWTFLSDASRKLQKDLDIQEYTDPHHDPMLHRDGGLAVSVSVLARPGPTPISL